MNVSSLFCVYSGHGIFKVYRPILPPPTWVLFLCAGVPLTVVVLDGRVDCFGITRDSARRAVLERFMREGSNGEEGSRFHFGPELTDVVDRRFPRWRRPFVDGDPRSMHA
jgi:hypothetical protein